MITCNIWQRCVCVCVDLYDNYCRYLLFAW